MRRPMTCVTGRSSRSPSPTGARDNAIASAKLKHVDLDEREFFQDGREIGTKFAKTFPTFFFPVGEDIESIVRDWIAELRHEHEFGTKDPLFPPTKVTIADDGNFVREGFEKRCWSGAGPIRDVFKELFVGRGFRRSILIRFARRSCDWHMSWNSGRRT